MSSETKVSYSGGIGFTGLLTIVFIILKLVGTIDWSWWWVLSPLWLPWVLFAFAWFIIGIMSFLLLGGRNKYKKFR